MHQLCQDWWLSFVILLLGGKDKFHMTADQVAARWRHLPRHSVSLSQQPSVLSAACGHPAIISLLSDI